MATQWQTYDGNNIFNNEVTVNHTTKKLDFKPIKSRLKLSSDDYDLRLCWLHAINLFSLAIKILFFMLVWIAVFDLVAWNFGVRIGKMDTQGFAILMFIIFSLPSISIMLMLGSKFYRNKIYPYTNAILHIINEMMSFRKGIYKKTYDAQWLNKKLCFEFKNMMLKYKATGDVAKQLSVVKIRSTARKDTGNWFAIFEFKKKPISGELRLRYI